MQPELWLLLLVLSQLHLSSLSLLHSSLILLPLALALSLSPQHPPPISQPPPVLLSPLLHSLLYFWFCLSHFVVFIATSLLSPRLTRSLSSPSSLSRVVIGGA